MLAVFFSFCVFCVRFSVFCRFLRFCSTKGRFLEKFSGTNFCFWGVVLVLCFWWVFAYVFASFLAVRSRNCPSNAEKEQPFTALQQSEVRAPGGVQLGRGTPRQSPSPGDRRRRDVHHPLPPPPPPPIPHATAAPIALSYPMQWTLLHTKPKAPRGGNPSGDPPPIQGMATTLN